MKKIGEVMRVITGTAKGRKLKALEGNEVRPTTERVKEAIFSIIQFETEGRLFLDLFAGSGQMGIEALSRGAKGAVFVDERRESINIIRQNLQSTKLENHAQLLQMDAFSYIRRNHAEKFDIAFLDPPYTTGILQEILPLVTENMKKTGVIICENPVFEEIPEKINRFTLDRNYRYGKIMISVYRCEEVMD